MLSSKGFIPLPDESEDLFLKRVARLSKAQEGRDAFKLAYSLIEDLYDITPDWVPVEKRNQGLSPWEAAVTWEESHVDGSIDVKIQIRDDIGKKWWNRYYCFEEILSHELVHAVRAGFHQDRFEEILAYRTSSISWRRWLGPLFRSPLEVKIFIGLLLLSLSIQWVEIFIGLPFFLSGFMFFPLIALGVGVVRLSYDQYLFKKCLARVGKALSNSHRALAVMIRLTDQEIVSFAHASSEEIYLFAENEKSFRWKMIASRYFKASGDGGQQEQSAEACDT